MVFSRKPVLKGEYCVGRVFVSIWDHPYGLEFVWHDGCFNLCFYLVSMEIAASKAIDLQISACCLFLNGICNGLTY